jgi:hypothetical protein
LWKIVAHDHVTFAVVAYADDRYYSACESIMGTGAIS